MDSQAARVRNVLSFPSSQPLPVRVSSRHHRASHPRHVRPPAGRYLDDCHDSSSRHLSQVLTISYLSLARAPIVKYNFVHSRRSLRNLRLTCVCAGDNRSLRECFSPSCHSFRLVCTRDLFERRSSSVNKNRYPPRITHETRARLSPARRDARILSSLVLISVAFLRWKFSHGDFPVRLRRNFAFN